MEATVWEARVARTRTFFSEGWASWWLLLGAFTMFVGLQYYAWPQIGDDSFIYFRYAERLARGALSWSDGVPAVEGYSSPLWLGLLVVGTRLGVPLIWWAKGLGSLCSLIAFVSAASLAHRAGAHRLAVGGACLLVALTPGLHFWAASGLETSLYAALFAGFAVTLLGSGPWWVLPVMLIGISRPEGPAMVVVAIGLVALRDRKLPRVPLICLAVLPSVAWEVFRLAAYGAPLPNTYYAKASGGLTQVVPGLVYAAPVLLAALPLLLGWWPRKGSARGPRLVLLWVLALLAVVVGGGGDWMWHGRLLVPVLPVLVAVGAPLWSQGMLGRLVVVLAVLPLLPTLVPMSWMKGASEGEQLPVFAWQEGEMAWANADLAARLVESYPSDTLMAVNHAGALPYYTGFRAIDMTGLNDAHIARVSGTLHQKHDSDYVLDQTPDLIVLNTRVRPGTDGVWYHPGYWAGETALVMHPEFARCYAPLEEGAMWRWAPTGENYILIYERTCQ